MMKNIKYLIICQFLLAFLFVMGCSDHTPVVFADRQVETQIRKLLNKETGDILVSDMRDIKEFIILPDREIKIATLVDLRYCVNLENLSVWYQPIESIECLRDLKRLKSITLSYCKVSDVSPLLGKESLEYVNLFDNPIKDATTVLSLPNLKFFCGAVKDISALRRTSNLVEFWSNEKIEDITPLFGHMELHSVSLERISNEDFLALIKNCKKLNNIIVRNATIQYSSLASLGNNISTLTIQESNLIQDLNALPSHPNLHTLLLNNNQIKDLTPFASLTGLSSLDLHSNGIEDISPLAGLENLETLRLDCNNVNDFDPLLKLKKLRTLGVDNPDSDEEVFRKLEEQGCVVFKPD